MHSVFQNAKISRVEKSKSLGLRYNPCRGDEFGQEQIQKTYSGCQDIESPKWCGKTWTSSYHSKSEIFLGDPAGNFQNRNLAEISPELVLEGPHPRLIDEWQEVPQVWDAVRYKIDRTTKRGQYILTGSATPYHKGILHSGASRIAKIRMRPMSLYESGDSSGLVSLENVCHGKLEPVMTVKADSRQTSKRSAYIGISFRSPMRAGFENICRILRCRAVSLPGLQG